MVYFVGAGPGAADLITVRGMRLLEDVYKRQAENLHMQKACCIPAKESDIILQPCRFMMQRAKKK